MNKQKRHRILISTCDIFISKNVKNNDINCMILITYELDFAMENYV